MPKLRGHTETFDDNDLLEETEEWEMSQRNYRPEVRDRPERTRGQGERIVRFQGAEVRDRKRTERRKNQRKQRHTRDA
ncbi:MAG: hypothetical protein GFH27_549333n72 [Chloroflexi bacterium AL-W]|nr:hypothetical protein [Chloroflexi bacterium AL-N1]NOK70475.1 hypothetical protein [Chloroflexi bacterium AL-N10]NOK78166.1 hypothetical protein [Chloroflexi bacterium AL-N5]NOK85265.1 hypothetical protein [Chloroflexi bacterium AL-W]NOK92030.1 hypothetical protein [Chloroflexi bacterium AL-N15]